MKSWPYKKSKWAPGMTYAMPLPDGSFRIAQAIDTMWPNVIYVALFSNRYQTIPAELPQLKREPVVSLSATWKQHLNRGQWAALGVAIPVFTKSEFPNEQFASDGYVGASNSDAGLLSDFLAAFHGIEPWNVMYKEDYWERYLMFNVSRPSSAVVMSAEERAAYREQHFGVASGT